MAVIIFLPSPHLSAPRELRPSTPRPPHGAKKKKKRKADASLGTSHTTGGIFRASLTFPTEYPLRPPTMKFTPPIFHPNVYPSGEVCISILHPPEEDKYGYENISERWSPVQTPETILLSVISMLSGPNDESPANVEAARLWREDPKEFRRRCRACVRESLGD